MGGSDRPVALVTGSTSGIGAAVARRLAAEGHMVALHSRASAAAGEALAAELGASYTAADLATDDGPAALVRAVLARHGRLDVLVNSAGITATVPHADLKGATAEIWRRLHQVNVIAPWLLVAEAEGALREAAARGRPAAVVNIGSHAGTRPKGASIPYAASKAALHHMTRLLAKSLAPAIRVNAVAPGLVDTPMTASWVEAQRLWAEGSPMRRAARPEDVADLVFSLVRSDYVTGEVVMLDGGLNLM
ncbi:NAD(P)-dependent dehydrogenase (short-subunit alcohol dehydrogenase family) [Inquilinus ginsengisoli]|uniref:NAD(P)-dependent dehydrogenase (Short-subunit alcohol dehydrogenase family) n=1 Tax=Inquilinus ginsengisoli TaxID=363840 RepID=A0ABU1JUU9_9PROT|nr:SDR family oxidoreductase [Inquilinus ginsengisoli]MDR6292404.1 NAD(P)-dependent dehydrogenase (short-subunit alcohol dehydrogenase family) [Inquilinus ginsengisoli]